MTGPEPALRYVWSSASDVGCARTLNEDAFLARPEAGLWAVADGMGGHDSGDLASRAVIDGLRRVEAPRDAADLLADVQWRIREAHLALRREAAGRGKDQIIGTTVVALLVAGRHFACLWAGDSRLYLLRDGALSQVTRDHSLVQDLVDAGQLAPEDAESHPHANVITRAVGAARDLDLEKRHDRLLPGDRLLLCSDGLTRYVGEPEIARALADSTVAAAAQTLVDLALHHKTRDNVTAVVVGCEAAPDAAAAGEAAPGDVLDQILADGPADRGEARGIDPGDPLAEILSDGPIERNTMAPLKPGAPAARQATGAGAKPGRLSGLLRRLKPAGRKRKD